MPIEIRELVIKAAVSNDNSADSGGEQSSTQGAEDAVQISLEQISEMKRKDKER